MLKILGEPDRKNTLCDGISRRDFLKIGGLGVGGLSLPQLLQAEAQAGIRNSQKAVSMIYLVGGPPHQDMYDIKTEAPSEIAGSVPADQDERLGIEICEHLPRLASMMDKLVPIRSIVDAQAGHDAYQCFTGRHPARVPAGGWPQFGSVVSKLQGPVHVLRAAVRQPVLLVHTWTLQRAGIGILGCGENAVASVGTKPRGYDFAGRYAGPAERSQALLSSMDRIRREMDTGGKMSGMDVFIEQAMAVLTSSRLVDALNLSRKIPNLAHYRTGDETVFMDGNGPRAPAEFAVGPATGRGRLPRGDGQLQQMGLARRRE